MRRPCASAKKPASRSALAFETAYGFCGAQRRRLVDRQRGRRPVELGGADHDHRGLRRLVAHRLEQVQRHRRVVAQVGLGLAPRLADVGARGEVVDDVGLRVADRRAHHLGVEQVDAQPARAREVDDHVTRGGARATRWRPAKPEAPVMRTRRLSRPVRRRPRGARRSRGRWRRRRRRRSAPGRRRAGSAAARARRARSRTAGGASRPARTRAGCPTAPGSRRRRGGRARAAAVAGQVATCSASPSSTPRAGRGPGRLGATFA